MTTHAATTRWFRGLETPPRAWGPDARMLLALLVATDLAFTALHGVHLTTTLLPDWRFSLEKDGGFAEYFQYTKEYWIAILLGVSWVRTRRFTFAPWLGMFAYILADDALQLHEFGGESIGRHLGYADALGLRAQDFGELSVYLVVGVPLVAAAIVAYRGATDAARATLRDLTRLIALFALFGVVLDIAHVWIDPPVLRLIVGTLEDGGELLTMSVACAYVYNHFLRAASQRARPAPA